MSCDHPDFAAQVDVSRLTDVGAFTADVRIQCSACGEAFVFLGPELGLHPAMPTVSVDRTELRAPIAPQSDPTVRGRVGFRIRQAPGFRES